MKNIFNFRSLLRDPKSIHSTIEQALAAAGLDTTSVPMQETSRTIRRALGMAEGGVLEKAEVRFDSLPTKLDLNVVEETEAVGAPDKLGTGTRVPAPGGFRRYEFVSPMGRLSYKLYVPSAPTLVAMPVVIMLHGCTQSSDDFAIGTQMNHLAEEHGFLVVYPEQAAHANPSRCWNWFNPQDQMRGRGEPGLLAGIVQQVVQVHGADSRRIFVAGLSAGAAMALVLGETYPELIAGVGVHSGLPYGIANDVPSAMSAMKGGHSRMAGVKGIQGAGPQPSKVAVQALPTIIFHGDRDHTVQQSNGLKVALQALNAYESVRPDLALKARTTEGAVQSGRAFSCTAYVDDAGFAPIELWTVHGAGHAWSGGNASGSYTDPSGPNASAQMVRFFLALPHSGSA